MKVKKELESLPTNCDNSGAPLRWTKVEGGFRADCGCGADHFVPLKEQKGIRRFVDSIFIRVRLKNSTVSVGEDTRVYMEDVTAVNSAIEINCE